MIYRSKQNYRDCTETIEKVRNNSHKVNNFIHSGKRLSFKPVDSKTNQPFDIDNVDGLITIDVYEGYTKLGRYKLSDLKVKFH